jgi:putative FmdB family regulatory protein
MPIYEYECAKCHKVTEALLKVGEKDPRKCEHCGGKLSRLISRTSFHLKGGGWGKDLYASNKPESKPADGSQPAATGEGKAEAASESKPVSKPDAKGDTKSAAPAEKPSKAEPAAKPATKSPAQPRSKKAG